MPSEGAAAGCRAMLTCKNASAGGQELLMAREARLAGKG